MSEFYGYEAVTTYTLSLYASTDVLTPTVDFYYRINAGSWIFFGSLGGNNACGLIGTIIDLSPSDTVEWAVETSGGVGQLYNFTDNTSTCPSAGTAFGGDRAPNCTNYASSFMDSNKSCAMGISAAQCI
jgi:hypothetical protein